MARIFIVFSIFCFGFIAETPKKPVIVIDDTRFQDTDLLWDLKALSAPPAVSWMDSTATVRSLVYESVDYKGKPTQVFAYYSNPDLGMKYVLFEKKVLTYVVATLTNAQYEEYPCKDGN